MLKSGKLYDDSLDVADTMKYQAEKLDSARKIVEHRSRTITREHSENINQSDPVSAKVISRTSDTLNPESPKRKRGRPRKAETNDSKVESR